MALSFDAVDENQSWYAPALHGNRQDPNPFAVLLSGCSAQELKRLERASVSDMTAKGDAGVYLDRARKLQESIIKKHVHNVRGFNVGDITPTDGASLLVAINALPAALCIAIFDDILEAIQDSSKLRAGLLDTLRPASE